MRHWILIGLLSCSDSDKSRPVTDTGTGTSPTLCPVTLSYQTDSAPDGVLIAGSFNDWDPTQTPLSEAITGHWAVTIALEPGLYPYQFVESIHWSQGGAELWTCDVSNPLIHCEEGTAADLDWTQDCTPGTHSCNSLLRVEDCSMPRISVAQVRPDLQAGSVAVDLHVQVQNSADKAEVTLDDIDASWSDETGLFHVELSGLSAQQHTFGAQVIDADLQKSDLVIAVNMDGWSWEGAVIYHAMIDRVANAKAANDHPEGTTHPITDYAGGDLAGLSAALPYLDDLGVNTLWLSNPQAGPQGAWAGDCNATYSGYHGFWPASWEDVDKHLGNKAALQSLIDDAHARGMRVIVDWVGNHVHQDHPILSDWPQSATHELAVCNEQGDDGQLNWDRIPEACWFAPYLPDLDQSDPAVLTATIDAAIGWAEQYGLDGLRIDAAKHMPHSVSWNLQSQVKARLEHSGSDFDFMLLGETFDDAQAINAFIGPDQLDGQFDFPLYWQLREAFIYDTADLSELVHTASSMAERYPNGQMSTFLGNLDVGRFITTAAEWTDDVCPDGALRQASAPTDSAPYDRLLMAWTFLFSQPGMPLIYYGDEWGLPGYGDPDNRQPLWWTADVQTGDVESVADQLDREPARVLHGVKALIKARRETPALASGQTMEWWDGGPQLYAYSRTNGAQGALVIISRLSEEITVSNGLEFAGLPAGRTFQDAVTGEQFSAVGDSLSVTMAPMSARLLLPQED